MSYPDYPNNRLIVNGVDLTEQFKMVLVDGYSLSPPEPKTYVVDIPGASGQLDLTESLMGDTAYGNRKQEFEFYLIGVKDFEKVKTAVSNFLHGKAFDYQMTMDPDYTYHGRFKVSSYTHSSYSIGKVGVMKISIDANPFKYKPTQEYKVDAIGGNVFYFESGRKRVRPIIETEDFLKVIFNGKLYTLPSGTWTINDVMFENGVNELYLNSYSIHNLTWGDLKNNGTTWGDFGKKRLYQWYKANGDSTNIETKTWSDLSDMTWGDLSIVTWNDLTYVTDVDVSNKNVVIKYDWGDL